MHAQQSVAAWQLDQDSATAYEEYLVGRFFARWAERLVRHADLAPAERVLDAGCGTGIVARTATRAVAGLEVAGLDVNEGMLAEARRRDDDGAVTWHAGALERIPFDDGHFNVVLSQQVLQFVPERDRALREIHRVLAPGGRFVFALLRDIQYHASYEALATALDRHAGKEVGEMMRSPFSGPDSASLRSELSAAGFRDVAIRHDILDVRFPSASEYLRQEAASSPLAGPLGRLDDASVQALVADIEQRLTPFTDDAGVTFPMETRFVTARRPPAA